MTQAVREIVLDVETTGRSQAEHKIIEVCAIAIEGSRETGEVYHQMFNPEREVEYGAEQVHGWSWEKLKGFPLFRREARRLADFLGDSPIVAHNGKFDIGFLQKEFAAAHVPVTLGPLVDTLKIARDLWPTQKNNLDAICTRLGIDRSEREKHGALIDVRLLIQAYVKMTGRDQLIPMNAAPAAVAEAAAKGAVAASAGLFSGRAARAVPLPSADEIARHEAFVARLGDKAKGIAPIWLREAASAV